MWIVFRDNIRLYSVGETLCVLLLIKNKLIDYFYYFTASCLTLHTNRPLHTLIVMMGVGLVKGAGM